MGAAMIKIRVHLDPSNRDELAVAQERLRQIGDSQLAVIGFLGTDREVQVFLFTEEEREAGEAAALLEGSVLATGEAVVGCLGTALASHAVKRAYPFDFVLPWKRN
jgi:hypothetical protein